MKTIILLVYLMSPEGKTEVTHQEQPSYKACRAKQRIILAMKPEQMKGRTVLATFCTPKVEGMEA